MAWGQKYETGCTDFYGKVYRAKFYFEDYSGNVTTYQGGGNSIELDYLNESDDLFNPIRASEAIITIKITDFNFVLGEDLYSVEQMYCQVKVFDEEVSTTVPCFVGYVDADQYKEAFDVVPYNLTVVCIDGLILLKDLPYYDTIEDSLEDSGAYYDNRVYEHEIVLAILAKIGYYEFKEFINIYEINMNSGVADSPMDQLKIDNDVFRDMTCEEVLIHIASKYNAWIIQNEGIIHFVRPIELVQNIVYGRYFTPSTSSGGESTAVTFNPTLYINRPTNPSLLRQVPGGEKMAQAPVQKININQDYGYKESWIDNYNFELSSFGSQGVTGYFIDGWTAVTGGGDYNYQQPISILVPNEKNGVQLLGRNNQALFANWTAYLKSVFGEYAIITTDVVGLEIVWSLYNDRDFSITGTAIYFVIKDVAGTRWLKYRQSTGAYSWESSFDYIYFTYTCEPGFKGWQTFHLDNIPGLPVNGPYEVRIYSSQGWALAADICVKEIKFYTTSSKTVSKRIKRKLRQRVIIKIGNRKGSDITILPKYYTTTYKEADAENNIVEHSFSVQNNIRGGELDFDYIIGDVSKLSSPPSDADVGLENIIEQFKGALFFHGYKTSLILTAQQFALLYASTFPDQVVSSSGYSIILSAEVAGVDFTGGDASISNLTGDLSGTAYPEYIPNDVGSPMIWEITLSGGSGSCTIEAGGHPENMIFYGADITDTIDNFLALHGGDYGGLTLSRRDVDILVITGVAGGVVFDVVLNDSGISGTPIITDYGTVAVARMDIIVLSGSSGTANVSCDGHTHSISMVAGWLLTNTTLWNTRYPGGENKPLLALIADEIAKQYSRPKQLIQMPFQEMFEDLNESDFYIKSISLWSISGCTFASQNGYVRIISTSTSPMLNKASLSINGVIKRIIQIKYRVSEPISTLATGLFYYRTSGHGSSASYYKTIPALNVDKEWHTLLLDMSSLTAGGNDWITNTITEVWIYLTGTSGVTVDIESIGFVNQTVKLVRPFNRLGCYYDDLLVDQSALNIKNSSLWLFNNSVLTAAGAFTLSDNLVANGDFFDGSAWWAGDGGWALEDNHASADGGDPFACQLRQDILTVGGSFLIRWELPYYEDGGGRVNAGTAYSDFSGEGAYEVELICTGNTYLSFTHAYGVFWLDNISVFRKYYSGQYMRFTSTGSDPNMRIENTLNIKGGLSRVLSMRYRVVSMESGSGASHVFYQTAGHGFSGSYYKQFDLNEDGLWHTLLLDMSALTAGGTDWIDNTITGLRFDWCDNNGVVIDIEWIGFSRPFVVSRGNRIPRQRTLDLDLLEIIT